MTFLQSLKLHNFRSYEQAQMSGLENGLVVLTGANGAGKTNVLEAVSLLSPGKGLRGAKAQEIQKREEGRAKKKEIQNGWAISADIHAGFGPVKIGTGLDDRGEKRVVRIDGQAMRSQNALAEYVSCVWLTPQMDRLFLDSARERRKFLDRLVFAFDPGHAGRVTRYENALRQRSKLLQEGSPDSAWLSGLEAQVAETGIAIAAARLDFAGRLQKACEKAGEEPFPLARLAVSGMLEEALSDRPALEVEEVFVKALAGSRGRDALTGGAAEGPHKSDLVVRYAAKDMAADQCSTGEQKALLIGLILAHARLIAAERGSAPILLLDEVAAHLDEGRRAALYDLLLGLGGQVWLTGTESALFAAVEGRAQFFEVRDGEVQARDSA